MTSKFSISAVPSHYVSANGFPPFSAFTESQKIVVDAIAEQELEPDINVVDEDPDLYYQVVLSNIMKTEFCEDTSPPAPPPGFVKVKNFSMPFIRKATVINSIYFKRQRVSCDRLMRFFSQRQGSVAKDDHVFSGYFTKFSINGSEEFAQVLGFRRLTGRKDNVLADHVSLDDKDIGAILCLYKADDNKKLHFYKTLIQPVALSSFVRHVCPNELKDLLTL